MKVKNLWVSVITLNNLDKVVIVREVSFVKKVIRIALNDYDKEYKCIFSNKSLWLKRQDIVPLVMFLEIDEVKKECEGRN